MTKPCFSFPSLLALVCLSTVIASPLHASMPRMNDDEPLRVAAAEILPESPGAVFSTSLQPTEILSHSDALADSAMAPEDSTTAGKFHRTIQPGQTAQPLNAGDKFLLSLRTRVTAISFAGTFFAAGIQHIQDGRPHYGVDRGAFGERLGASALTGTSRAILSYGLFASMFRQDPRYYVMGNQKSVKHRAIYSATRVLLVGGPNERSHVNWSNLAGSASSSALANTYYPERDRSFGKTASSFASSLGIQAASNELSEFFGDILRKIRHK